MAPSTPLILPKSHPSPAKFQALLNRYKSLRLTSLLLSPSCFGSTHALEVAFPPEKWASRLTNPGATTIIIYEDAASSPSPTDDSPSLDKALTAEWLATLTITGPLDSKTLSTSLHEFGPTTDVPISQYVINGMFVTPSARGKQLGTKLIEFAKAHVSSEIVTTHAEGKEKERARISLIVDFDNDPARKTYARSGFEIVRRYWFNDYREGRESTTEAAIMALDL
ncbi:gnat family [Colletotrichum scovillei]|uniref:Gnat family n=1 Tax=Colletotrichum scovillei TaxID=1209932 RepID=A0A9P7ULV0_9PEZI|nr:gnat family [Colletotrichum scovillei]KAG7075893.1 gnat family [Colletotrichum scovillei]KAG7083011.1 gnat family [Colletotrichum scovillei]